MISTVAVSRWGRAYLLMRLARGGVFFRQCHAMAPACGPDRAALPEPLGIFEWNEVNFVTR